MSRGAAGDDLLAGCARKQRFVEAAVFGLFREPGQCQQGTQLLGKENTKIKWASVCWLVFDFVVPARVEDLGGVIRVRLAGRNGLNMSTMNRPPGPRWRRTNVKQAWMSGRVCRCPKELFRRKMRSNFESKASSRMSPRTKRGHEVFSAALASAALAVSCRGQ